MTPGAADQTIPVTGIVNPTVTPSLVIAASINNLCAGTTVTFTATPANEGSTPVYQWLVNGNNTGTNSPTFASSTLSNGDVIICRLTSSSPCLTIPEATSNNVAMIVNPVGVPAVSINISANNVCSGTPVTFTATSTNGGSSPVYQWLLNGNNAGTNSTTFSSSTFANGDVVRCVMTSSLACSVPANIASNNITTKIFPMAFVNAGANRTINKGGSVTLTAKASGNIADITWSPSAGLNNNKILTPLASPTSTTLYTVTVQTAGGCMAVSSVTVNVDDKIWIPNTFTPNGDGTNDTWDIQNLNTYNNCTVNIFDRSGQNIFTSLGYGKPWDGTYRGSAVPVGTYYYIIDLQNGSAVISGFVLIVR